MITVVIIVVFQLFMDFLRSLFIFSRYAQLSIADKIFLHNFDELSIRIATQHHNEPYHSSRA